MRNNQPIIVLFEQFAIVSHNGCIPRVGFSWRLPDQKWPLMGQGSDAQTVAVKFVKALGPC